MGLDSRDHTRSGPSGGGFFLHDVIRHRGGKQKFGTSGKSPARPHHRSKCPHERMRQAGVTAYAKAPDIAHPGLTIPE
jgi:phage tail tape-measure protein